MDQVEVANAQQVEHEGTKARRHEGTKGGERLRFRTVGREEWLAEGRRLFGDDVMEWRLVCPICGHVAEVRDYKEAGAPEGAVGFSCIGRYREGSRKAFGGKGAGPCNYTSGGLFVLNTLFVESPDGSKTPVFEFDKEATG